MEGNYLAWVRAVKHKVVRGGEGIGICLLVWWKFLLSPPAPGKHLSKMEGRRNAVDKHLPRTVSFSDFIAGPLAMEEESRKNNLL